MEAKPIEARPQVPNSERPSAEKAPQAVKAEVLLARKEDNAPAARVTISSTAEKPKVPERAERQINEATSTVAGATKEVLNLKKSGEAQDVEKANQAAAEVSMRDVDALANAIREGVLSMKENTEYQSGAPHQGLNPITVSDILSN